MAKKRPSLQRLRQEIRAAKVDLRPERSDDPVNAWLRRHHDRICDYLAAHLLDYAELSAWRIAYTALHELLSAVLFQPRREDPGADEKRIWATFDPAYFALAHVPALRPFSQLPTDFSPRDFQHHYAGFFHFLATRGVMTQAHAEHLQAELHRALWGDALGVA